MAKKFEKLKNAVSVSFQGNRGCEWPRKRENKNYRSVPFQHDP